MSDHDNDPLAENENAQTNDPVEGPVDALQQAVEVNESGDRLEEEVAINPAARSIWHRATSAPVGFGPYCTGIIWGAYGLSWLVVIALTPIEIFILLKSILDSHAVPDEVVIFFLITAVVLMNALTGIAVLARIRHIPNPSEMKEFRLWLRYQNEKQQMKQQKKGASAKT